MERKILIFENRNDAGEQLAEKVSDKLPLKCVDPIVLGIPRGGLAIGYPIARKLSCPLEPITVRKLPIPSNDQMGFGVVTIDKEIILNDEVMRLGYVQKKEIEPIVEEVYKEVKRRDKVYRKGIPFPDLKNRCVIIADDGLATGYTMIGAVKFARQRHAARIIAAVPAAHYESYNIVRKEVDDIICIIIDDAPSFAVASYYINFPDMTDEDVMEILNVI